MVAVVTLLRVLATSVVLNNGNKLSNVRSFIILRAGEGLTFSNKDNSAKFSGEKKKHNEVFRVVYFLRISEITLSQIFYV